MRLAGRALVYKRNDINTDEIIPARYLNLDKEEELSKHAMEDLDIDFVNNVRVGDFIVTGENFGCGSSREHAIWALRGAGIRAIIASSFSRIFYRNAINNGFLVIECPAIADKVDYGDLLEIDTDKGVITNKMKSEEYSFTALPDFTMALMEKGGLINYIKGK
jgi:3-isopropylmalate/(R)-2-methylmalate dehydratase small subunit